MENKNVIKMVNTLLEYLHDSKDGYQECAQSITDSQLRELFQQLSAKRQTMINELEKVIVSFGGIPEKKGSTLAAAHRIFLDIKSLITGGDMDAIVTEIRRGENATMMNYKEVIDNEIPGGVSYLLKQQLAEIESDLERINELVEEKNLL